MSVIPPGFFAVFWHFLVAGLAVLSGTFYLSCHSTGCRSLAHALIASPLHLTVWAPTISKAPVIAVSSVIKHIAVLIRLLCLLPLPMNKPKMPLICAQCKKFISTSNALASSCAASHVFHSDCLSSAAGPDALRCALDSVGFSCPICVGQVTNTDRQAVHAGASAPARSPLDESGALGGLMSALLDKVTNIEAKLQDLTAISAKLSALEGCFLRYSASLDDLTTKTDSLTATTHDLNKRVGALECSSSSRSEPCAAGSRLEARLEALEQSRLSSELIIFGVLELQSENLLDIVKSIAATIGVDISTGDIQSCFRIRASHGRPRPLIVRLISNEIRNRWIGCKRARGVLEGAAVSASLAGSRIDISERLTAPTRRLLSEARRAVVGGMLSRAWTRNGRIYAVKNDNSPPVVIKHHDHLKSVLASAPPPPAPSTLPLASRLPAATFAVTTSAAASATSLTAVSAATTALASASNAASASPSSCSNLDIIITSPNNPVSPPPPLTVKGQSQTAGPPSSAGGVSTKHGTGAVPKRSSQRKA